MGCADVAVLVGVSTVCSMSSCLTISSASNAWSGESEPEEAGGSDEHESRSASEDKRVHARAHRLALQLTTSAVDQSSHFIFLISHDYSLYFHHLFWTV